MGTSPHAVDRDLLLLGDFNIPSLKSELFAILADTGFTMPACLAGVHGSDLAMNKRYDQLLVLPSCTAKFTGRGGALDFYTGGHRALYPRMTKTRFTYELSDHLPLWAELAA